MWMVKGKVAIMPNMEQPLEKNGKHAFFWYGLSCVIILIDQISKAFFENQLDLYQSIPVIEPVFHWTLAYNYGAAFSFLANQGGWQKWFFAALALLVSLSLIWYLYQVARMAKILSLGLALILGGAIGNLIDRIQYGYVIDFIHIHYANVWHYPIFNVADIGICVGVGLVLVDTFFLEKKRQNPSIPSDE